MKNIAKQQNEQLAAALLTPRAEGNEAISARAGRCYVRIKEKNAEGFRKRLLSAHRIGVNSNGRKKEDRWYPPFEGGKTTTAAYVRAFQRLNARCNVSELEFTANDRPAATYEGGALDFDAVVEHDDSEELVADLL